ncbi:class I SAM-dependent methyltransferase [Candidatus Pacearchaeota archaeon]|nr:class I SAM-dependent methyltransferase [Candidatus Pacearchaeota archaeon]
MNKENFGSILKKDKLVFDNNKSLEKYYENKWEKEGYKQGYSLFGINISKIYHKARHDVSFELINPNKNEIILDAGCGDGTWDFRIAKKCKKLIAIDISKNAFAQSKRKAFKNMVFKKMNVEQLNFSANSFDKIYCVETLEHLINPEKALKEFNRVLKNKGKLVISYPLIDKSVIGRIEKFLHIRKGTPVSEHLTEWEYDETISHIEKEGFKIVKSKGVVFDIGFLEKIRKMSKFFVMPLTKLAVSITAFPRNSYFAIMLFEKN